MRLKPEKIDPREVAAIFAFMFLLQAAPLDRVLIMAGLGMLYRNEQAVHWHQRKNRNQSAALD